MDYFIFVNPVTSSLMKYYEKTKSDYARDIDHLVIVNKNGLWIKETENNKERIITAANPYSHIISDVKIFEFNKNFNLSKKIIAKSADIKSNKWILKEIEIYSYKNGILKK